MALADRPDDGAGFSEAKNLAFVKPPHCRASLQGIGICQPTRLSMTSICHFPVLTSTFDKNPSDSE
jgi:hypothetical protein